MLTLILLHLHFDIVMLLVYDCVIGNVPNLVKIHVFSEGHLPTCVKYYANVTSFLFLSGWMIGNVSLERDNLAPLGLVDDSVMRLRAKCAFAGSNGDI